jgi:hypothetical protein
MHAMNEHQGNEVCKFAENSYGQYMYSIVHTFPLHIG